MMQAQLVWSDEIMMMALFLGVVLLILRYLLVQLVVTLCMQVPSWAGEKAQTPVLVITLMMQK